MLFKRKRSMTCIRCPQQLAETDLLIASAKKITINHASRCFCNQCWLETLRKNSETKVRYANRIYLHTLPQCKNRCKLLYLKLMMLYVRQPLYNQKSPCMLSIWKVETI